MVEVSEEAAQEVYVYSHTDLKEKGEEVGTLTHRCRSTFPGFGRIISA